MLQTQIDPITGSVVLLRTFAGPKQTGVATGFLHRRDGKTFLITNWHVVTGRDTANPTSSTTGEFCTHIQVSYLHGEGGRISLASQIDDTIQLNNSNGEGMGWLQHPTYQHQVDVAAVPIVLPPGAINLHLNDEKFFDRFILNVADSVYVLGYPWGLRDPRNPLPVWKGGSVASIPGVPRNGLPRFLIDARTYKGMSGGPVICLHTLSPTGNRIHNFDNTVDPVMGTIGYFCGVYSGRAMVTPTDFAETNDPSGAHIETDLGYVWRPSLIDEIIDGGTPGSAV